MVSRSARALEPERVAPGAGAVMALAGALALGWALLAPRYAGAAVPPHLERLYFPSDWVLLGGLLAVMGLGAAKRCFGFGWVTLGGLLFGGGLPLVLAGEVAPPMMGLLGLGLAAAGLLLHASITRWRYWAATVVGSVGVALITTGRVGWTLSPLPSDPVEAVRPVVAAWAAAGFGLSGGALVALTALRGQRRR